MGLCSLPERGIVSVVLKGADLEFKVQGQAEAQSRNHIDDGPEIAIQAKRSECGSFRRGCHGTSRLE